MPLRIAEAEQAVADDHRDHGIAAAAAAIHGVHRGEDVRWRDARRAHALQLGREHVEQHFRIGVGVEVAPVLALDAPRPSSRALVRLPLCARQMPYGELT